MVAVLESFLALSFGFLHFIQKKKQRTADNGKGNSEFQLHIRFLIFSEEKLEIEKLQ